MRGCRAPASSPEPRLHPQLPRPMRNLARRAPEWAGPTTARRTPSRSSRLELAAAASPASTGGPAPGRALGAPRFQEAYFVAVASDSCWQFGLACQTSWCDRHAVRLSRVVGRGGRQRWSRAVQADSSTVGDPRPGLIAPRSEATRRQSSDTEISARIPEQDPDSPSVGLMVTGAPAIAHVLAATALRLPLGGRQTRGELIDGKSSQRPSVPARPRRESRRSRAPPPRRCIRPECHSA